jgi:hypothetical protein
MERQVMGYDRRRGKIEVGYREDMLKRENNARDYF